MMPRGSLGEDSAGRALKSSQDPWAQPSWEMYRRATGCSYDEVLSIARWEGSATLLMNLINICDPISSAQLQKFSAIQTLLPTVDAGIATYFPLREGTAQLGQMLFTCQIGCALPAKSTYSKFWLEPAGLLATKSPFESAAQSTERKPYQFFTTSSRVG